MDIFEVVRITTENKGGTFSVSYYPGSTRMHFTNKLFTSGFWVATGNEVSLPILTSESIINFVATYYEELNHGFLGVWYDSEDKIWYIEVSNHFGGRIEATEAMIERNQKAIWDIANNWEIRNKING